MVRDNPPAILQIHRDTLKPGCAAAFTSIEVDAARFCADLKAPHPHLAIEALTGQGEIWWLNGFESEAEKQRVYDAYANNRPLMAALAGIGKRRQDVIATDMDIFASYRADLSRGAPWTIAGARFFVVTVTKDDDRIEGSVFEAPDARASSSTRLARATKRRLSPPTLTRRRRSLPCVRTGACPRKNGSPPIPSSGSASKKHRRPRRAEDGKSAARRQRHFALGMGPAPVKSACGHAEPRTRESEARCQRQFAPGVGPRRQ